MKIAIVNDTTCNHIGCNLTMLSLKDLLNKNGMEILFNIPNNQSYHHYKKQLKKVDLVIVNGEGSIHDDLRPDLLEIAKEYPSVLVNSVFQNNTILNGINHFLHISVRESYSAKELKKIGIHAEIIPDIIFSNNFIKNYITSQKNNQVLITDSVLNEDENYLFQRYNNYIQLISNRPDKETIKIISKSSAICTGRLHGVVLAAMLNIPFSAYSSNTHKIKGLLHDMDALHLYKTEIDDARKNIPKNIPNSIHNYVVSAPSIINNFFQKLKRE